MQAATRSIISFGNYIRTIKVIIDFVDPRPVPSVLRHPLAGGGMSTPSIMTFIIGVKLIKTKKGGQIMTTLII